MDQETAEEWVVCRVFHKSAGGKKMSMAELQATYNNNNNNGLTTSDTTTTTTNNNNNNNNNNNDTNTTNLQHTYTAHKYSIHSYNNASYNDTYSDMNHNSSSSSSSSNYRYSCYAANPFKNTSGNKSNEQSIMLPPLMELPTLHPAAAAAVDTSSSSPPPWATSPPPNVDVASLRSLLFDSATHTSTTTTTTTTTTPPASWYTTSTTPTYITNPINHGTAASMNMKQLIQSSAASATRSSSRGGVIFPMRSQQQSISEVFEGGGANRHVGMLAYGSGSGGAISNGGTMSRSGHDILYDLA